MSTATSPENQKIRLHPAQREFLKSDALFRAFCGGIGSGKSWAGSYDLIRRAKSGRLYLIVAPTYAMLSDSTFRSFLSRAQELGIVDPSEVKRSAPPSIRLRTGAEVLFRSADEPDRLRGPNLSGIWMDEASLMALDAYSIAIGRLREGGEQGWLTASFTPKGRLHWTFETFAAGRPDTAIFHARTADNPFLPAGFHDTVRRQYTSTLAAQELEGEFLDAGGALFRRHWFRVVDNAPPLVRVRAWDLAATPKDEAKSRDPDWTAGVLLGKAKDGTIYVLDVRRVRTSPQQVQTLVRQTAEEDGRDVAIWMEQEPGSAGVALPGDLYTSVPDMTNRFWAVARSRSEGLGVSTGIDAAASAGGSVASKYNWAWLTMEFATLPYRIQEDSAVVDTYGVPNEGYALQNGWVGTRYITRHIQDFSRLTKLPYGFVQVKNPYVADQLKNVKEGVPFREGGGTATYTWMRVPLEGTVCGVNFALLNSAINTINNVAFDVFAANTLLFDHYATREYQGYFGEWLADVTFTFIHLPHPSSGGNAGNGGPAAGVPQGWNSVIEMQPPPPATGILDYYPTMTTGGQLPFPLVSGITGYSPGTPPVPITFADLFHPGLAT